MPAYVYIMTNKRNGILYTGVTTNLPRRGYEHRKGLIAGFTKRYGLKLLVYYEVFEFRERRTSNTGRAPGRYD